MGWCWLRPAGRFAGLCPAGRFAQVRLERAVWSGAPTGLCRVYSLTLALRAALQAFTALRLCRPGGRVTSFGAKEVTKKAWPVSVRRPRARQAAWPGRLRTCVPHSSPQSASMQIAPMQPATLGAPPMAKIKTKAKSALIRRCAPPSPGGRRERRHATLRCRRKRACSRTILKPLSIRERGWGEGGSSPSEARQAGQMA